MRIEQSDAPSDFDHTIRNRRLGIALAISNRELPDGGSRETKPGKLSCFQVPNPLQRQSASDGA